MLTTAFLGTSRAKTSRCCCREVRFLANKHQITITEIPRTAVRGYVQVQPTKSISQKPRRFARSSSESLRTTESFSPHQRQIRRVVVCRSDLNKARTAVRGISDFLYESLSVGTGVRCIQKSGESMSSSYVSISKHLQIIASHSALEKIT